MSSYTKPLIVTPKLDGKTWVVLDQFSYYLTTPEGPHISVRPGFTTDFASIPRIFWAGFPRWGKYGKAAVLHDWMYACNWPKCRKYADDIFYDAMLVSGTPQWQARAIWAAVRLFGGPTWRKRKNFGIDTDFLNDLKRG